MQDQDPAEPPSQTPSGPELAAEPPSAAPAPDALADAVIERRRAEFKRSLPRLLAALFDPPPPPPARSISRQRR
jgi:hypothetical protein